MVSSGVLGDESGTFSHAAAEGACTCCCCCCCRGSGSCTCGGICTSPSATRRRAASVAAAAAEGAAGSVPGADTLPRRLRLKLSARAVSRSAAGSTSSAACDDTTRSTPARASGTSGKGSSTQTRPASARTTTRCRGSRPRSAGVGAVSSSRVPLAGALSDGLLPLDDLGVASLACRARARCCEDAGLPPLPGLAPLPASLPCGGLAAHPTGTLTLPPLWQGWATSSCRCFLSILCRTRSRALRRGDASRAYSAAAGAANAATAATAKRTQGRARAGSAPPPPRGSKGSSSECARVRRRRFDGCGCISVEPAESRGALKPRGRSLPSSPAAPQLIWLPPALAKGLKLAPGSYSEMEYTSRSTTARAGAAAATNELGRQLATVSGQSAPSAPPRGAARHSPRVSAPSTNCARPQPGTQLLERRAASKFWPKRSEKRYAARRHPARQYQASAGVSPPALASAARARDVRTLGREGAAHLQLELHAHGGAARQAHRVEEEAQPLAALGRARRRLQRALRDAPHTVRGSAEQLATPSCAQRAPRQRPARARGATARVRTWSTARRRRARVGWQGG
eukprot:scaffold561_cov306-Prasinococcus_capsulatus_cf.AAC.1